MSSINEPFLVPHRTYDLVCSPRSLEIINDVIPSLSAAAEKMEKTKGVTATLAEHATAFTILAESLSCRITPATYFEYNRRHPLYPSVLKRLATE